MEIQAVEMEEQALALINQVLFAVSQEEVKQLLNRSIARMQNSKMTNETLLGIINTVIANLERFTPLEKAAQQWNNIKVARILLRRIRQNVQTQTI